MKITIIMMIMIVVVRTLDLNRVHIQGGDVTQDREVQDQDRLRVVHAVEVDQDLENIGLGQIQDLVHVLVLNLDLIKVQTVKNWHQH